MRISRGLVVSTAIVCGLGGLAWIQVHGPDRLAVRARDAVNHQRWDELYDITKNPRGMTSPWDKPTFVQFCNRYLGRRVRAELKLESDQGTVNFSKIWVVLLSTATSTRSQEILVFNDPVGGMWHRDMSIFSTRCNLEAAFAQEHLLNLAASIQFQTASDEDIGSYEFLLAERKQLIEIGVRSIRTDNPRMTLNGAIAARRSDLISVGREIEVMKIESRYAKQD